jgi:uncharacterized protein
VPAPAPAPPPEGDTPVAGGAPRLAAIGFAGGFLGSLLGVGGGFIMVPLQVLWAKIAQHRANGSSLAAIVPLSLAAVVIYALAGGKVDFRLVIPLVVGSVLGAYLGARWAARIPEAHLKRLVAVVLVLAGLKQLVFPG